MNLFFRLYCPADLDLLLMKRNMGKRFPQFVKNCLEDALNGVQSGYDPASVPAMGIPKSLSSCCVNIALNENDDADLIAFLQSFPQNARSAVVKKILSGSSAYFPADIYEAYAGMEHVCRSRLSSPSKEEHSSSEKPSLKEEEKPAGQTVRQQDKENESVVQKHEPDAEKPAEKASVPQNPKQEEEAGQPEDKAGLDKRKEILDNADDEETTEQKPAVQQENAELVSPPDEEPDLDSDDDMMKLLSGMVNHR